MEGGWRNGKRRSVRIHFPDGIRWRPAQEQPLIKKGDFDSQNIAFWSAHEERYLCYFRTFLESFIRPGLDPRNWVARANYPALGLIQTGAAELSVYVVRHYGQPSIHIERMSLRLDGFASLHAPYSGGEMVTRPLIFDGSELELNMATGAAGFVRVELLTAEGGPLPGCALGDCPEVIGDRIERIVRWRQGSDLRALAGRPVRLRFVMKDADVYSFRFRGR